MEKSLLKWLRLCNANKQTLHVLNNCNEAVRNGRYTWHHDSILFCHYLTTLKSIGLELFTGLVGFKNPDILFDGPRHDVLVKNGNKNTVIELPCCYETNFVKTRNHKIDSYSKL